MEIVRIRFLKRAVYDTNGPGKGPVYEAGAEHEVPRDQADRWTRRLMAEELPPVPPTPQPEAKPDGEAPVGGQPPPEPGAPPAPAARRAPR